MTCLITIHVPSVISCGLMGRVTLVNQSLAIPLSNQTTYLDFCNASGNRKPDAVPRLDGSAS